MDCMYPDTKPTTSYGRGCRCDRCKQARYAANRRWASANPERTKAYKQKWADSHKQHNRERARRFRNKNPELALRRSRTSSLRRELLDPSYRQHLRRLSNETKKRTNDTSRTVAVRHFRRWTSQENSVCRDTAKTCAEVAREIGRTKFAVANQRRRLGVDTSHFATTRKYAVSI